MTTTQSGELAAPTDTPVRLNGRDIRLALKAMGRTDTDLANAIGVHKGTLSRQLSGTTTPLISTVVLIWLAFGKRLELDEIVNVPGLTSELVPDVSLPGDPLASEDLEHVVAPE